MAEHVWCIRVGDADDYRWFDDSSDIADYLHENGVHGPLKRCKMFGVSAEGYQPPHNYISLYIGESIETPIREVSKEELAALNEQLKALND